MKKHMVFLCFWIFLLVLCGCDLNKDKSEEGEIQKEIIGTWQIKEAKIDVSQQNYNLYVSNDGSWIMKKGEEVINFGTYTKRGNMYIFKSDQNYGERFTVTATAIKADIIQLKVISSDGSKMELGGSKTGNGTMQNIVLGDLIETKKCEQTEKDIKKISQALDSYAVDYGEYPSDSFENLKAYLEPFYIRELPPVDGWGNIWLYYTFYAKTEPRQQYRLISFGSDGKPNPSITDKTSSKTKSAYNYDIVILNGEFISRCRQEN
jgi:hypothetical protein